MMSPHAPDAASANRRLGYVMKIFPRVSETFIATEALGLQRQGLRPRLFALHRGEAEATHAIMRRLAPSVCYVEEHANADEDQVRRASRQLAQTFGISDADRPRFLPRKYVRLALALAAQARAARIGHLHAHFASRSGHVTALAAALAGCSYSITAHAKDIFHAEVEVDVLRWKIEHARFFVTVSEYNRRYLASLVADRPEVVERIVCLYNGVDLRRFRAAAPAVRREPLILGVGRLVEKKGFAVLVEACRRLRQRGLQFRCEIIGGGDLESALRQQISAAGLDDIVRLRGVLASEAVSARMRAASIFALPCVVGHDGNVDALPTVLLEAMARARPAVSTTISGIPEIIVDGVTGLLVPPNDVDALTTALADLLSDPERAAKMGHAGRERAEILFDVDRNVAELAQRFAAALNDTHLDSGSTCTQVAE